MFKVKAEVIQKTLSTQEIFFSNFFYDFVLVTYNCQ